MPQWCICPLLQFWGPFLGHPPVPGAVRVSRVLSPDSPLQVVLALKILPEGFVSGCRLTLSLRAEHTRWQTGKSLERLSASDRQRCGEYILTSVTCGVTPWLFSTPSPRILQWGSAWTAHSNSWWWCYQVLACSSHCTRGQWIWETRYWGKEYDFIWRAD